MAERRMFAKTIVTSDAFLDMPMSARCLYFTLGMFADDDGFVNNPKSIMRQVGATNDDMNILLSKKFILLFDSGIIVIKHWKIHNYIQSDRYHETKYIEEKATLSLDENKAYTRNAEIPTKDTECIHDVYKTDTEDRLGKDRLGKDKDIHSAEKTKKSSQNIPREVVEVISYLNEKLGTRYKATTKENRELINGRLSEGYSVEELKEVIDKKYDEWHGTDMEKFLRPNTLFRPTNFENYLNQPWKRKKMSAVEIARMMDEAERRNDDEGTSSGTLGSVQGSLPEHL